MSKLYVKSRPHFRTIQNAASVKFPFPLDPRIRLAKLTDPVPQFGTLDPFYPESTIHLEGYRPNMIVGDSSDLITLAEQVGLGTVDLACIDHAIIALTRCGEAPLNDVARVVLWQTFGVPVFEIFISFDLSIIAYECELHEGWHLAPQVVLNNFDGELMLDAPGILGMRTALNGSLTGDKCPCGREGARLLHIEPVCPVQVLQPWAAIA